MTTCRCTAIKYATTELRSLDQRVLEEIGLGKPSNIGALDLLIDGYRTLF